MMVESFTTLLIVQLLIPLGLLAWLAFGRDRSRAGWLLRPALVAIYLAAADEVAAVYLRSAVTSIAYPPLSSRTRYVGTSGWPRIGARIASDLRRAAFSFWRSILPGGPGYFHAVRSYLALFIAGHPKQYLGHNPAGRLGIAALLLLIVIQAITGLVLAGTDLFYPPIGHWIAQWVAAPGVDPGTLAPYGPDCVGPAGRG